MIMAIVSHLKLIFQTRDLRSVTLLEAKAKVKDIAMTRERTTLKDVLPEGTFRCIFDEVLVDRKIQIKKSKHSCKNS